MLSKSDRTPPALSEALRALKAERRKPTDADRPPPKPLPGRRYPLIDGQISLDQAEDDHAA